jgi:hypothetical protein
VVERLKYRVTRFRTAQGEEKRIMLWARAGSSVRFTMKFSGYTEVSF